MEQGLPLPPSREDDMTDVEPASSRTDRLCRGTFRWFKMQFPTTAAPTVALVSCFARYDHDRSYREEVLGLRVWNSGVLFGAHS